MAPAGAGMPVKKLPAQAGLSGSSIMTLKRASRSAAADREHQRDDPARDFRSCRPQKYRISAGATPKLTKSARLSSSAPKREVPLSMRAIRPSMPSSAAANTIAASANSSRFSTAMRMAVSPAHSASSVIRLGTSSRTGIGLKRRLRDCCGVGSKGGKTMAAI